MIGRTLSHYKILAQLGSGGMGVVYRAEDTRLGREVALKFVSEDFVHDDQAIQRLRSEARAASALNHANICTIYDIGEEDGHPFIVMELMRGETLRDRLARGAIKVHQLLDIGIDVADALHSAHSDGIIHRDIKPGNIFLTERGQVKLLDFGLAKLTPDFSGSNATIATSDPTVMGITLGTINYMSPEQATGEQLDGRSDLFSLGVVLYECATGIHPFSGKTSAVTLAAILNKPAVAPIRLNPELPLRLQEVINNCLEKERDLRYQTAADLRADLRRLRRDLESGHARAVEVDSTATGAARAVASGPSSSVAPSSQTAQAVATSATPPHRSRGWLAAVSALIVLLVLSAVYFVSWPQPRGAAVPAPPTASVDGTVQNLLALARSGLAAGNYRAATAYATEVLTLVPGHGEATKIRDDANAMLARFDQSLEDARRQLARGDLSAAAAALEAARRLDPNAPAVLETASQLSQRLRERDARDAQRSASAPRAEKPQVRVEPPPERPRVAPVTPTPSSDAVPPRTTAVVPPPPAPSSTNVTAPTVSAPPATPNPTPPPTSAPPPPAPMPPPTSTAPASGTAPAPSAAAPPSAGRPAEQDDAAIRQLAATYARAIETKDVSLFRSIKPNLSGEEERRLREGFRAVTSQRVDLTIVSIDRRADEATVVVRRRDTIQSSGRPHVAESQQTLRLARTNGHWSIVDIR